MPQYTVRPERIPRLPAGLSMGEESRRLRRALEYFIAQVEDIADEHPGSPVKIVGGAWIDTTLRIETTPERAAELAKAPGIGSVTLYAPSLGPRRPSL